MIYVRCLLIPLTLTVLSCVVTCQCVRILFIVAIVLAEETMTRTESVNIVNLDPGRAETIKHRTTWACITRITNQIILFLCRSSNSWGRAVCSPQAGFAHWCECDRWLWEGRGWSPPAPRATQRCYQPISPSLVVTQLVTTLISDWSWCPPVTPEQPSLSLEGMWNMECWCST